MVCGPAGTRRRVYLPSAPVTVLCPVASTVTFTLLRAEPSPARVTVPVTVPVAWAVARETGAKRRVSTPERSASTGDTADEFRRIPVVLVVVKGQMRARREAPRK